VKELREKIRAYDAALVATPDYDYAIPGVLSSALDWCLRSRYELLLHPPAYVMSEPQMLIPFSRRQKFDAETGDLVDERTRERLRRFLMALAAWTQRLEEPLEARLRQARERRA